MDKRFSPARVAALAAGEDRYFTGVPCKHGHICERQTLSRHCVECNRMHQAKSSRRRYWADPDKSREESRLAGEKHRRARGDLTMAEYRQRRRDATLRHRAEKRETTDRRKRERAAERKAKKESSRIADKERRSASGKAWRAANPDRMRELLRAWKRANRDKVKAYEKGRGSSTPRRRAYLMKIQRGKCAYCRIRLDETCHVDHIIPRAAGGSNRRSNLQLTCAPCNLSKGARDPIEFAQNIGRLL